MISRYEFEILTYVERKGRVADSARETATELCLSWTTAAETTECLKALSFLSSDEEGLFITEAGLAALSPYRVKRAVILAAGFGSRMMPATADRPKPMVEVNGVRIIDTLLDALVAAGIREITIVGGYCYDKLGDLLAKYPFLRLIENADYASTNNISSAVLALDALHDGCYLCEADLYIADPQIITPYQYASNILGSYSLETDDWSFRMTDGCVSDYRKGNTYCYNYYGIAYFTAADCEKLNKDFAEVYARPDGKDCFWEFVPFVLKKEDYRVEIRPCGKRDIVEIDNYFELAQLDAGYRTKEDAEA